MSVENDDKLNRLHTELPEGVAAPSGWLNKLGITSQLINRYLKSGRLVRLGHRAYARPGVPVQGVGVLLGLHRLAGVPCHLSGMVALSLQGYSHFLPLSGGPAWNVTTKGPVPQWARKQTPHPPLRFRKDSLFSPRVERDDLKPWQTGIRDWTLPVSCPERAMLELLDDVQDADGFRHAAEILESMATLRPGMVTALLQDCKSVKVKRLFLLLAEHYRHAWLRTVDAQSVDLGRGKRQLVKGGKLNEKYAITIPEDFGAESW